MDSNTKDILEKEHGWKVVEGCPCLICSLKSRIEFLEKDYQYRAIAQGQGKPEQRGGELEKIWRKHWFDINEKYIAAGIPSIVFDDSVLHQIRELAKKKISPLYRVGAIGLIAPDLEDILKAIDDL